MLRRNRSLNDVNYLLARDDEEIRYKRGQREIYELAIENIDDRLMSGLYSGADLQRARERRARLSHLIDTLNIEIAAIQSRQQRLEYEQYHLGETYANLSPMYRAISDRRRRGG